MKKSLWIFSLIFLSLVVGPVYSWADDDSELDVVIAELSSDSVWTRATAAEVLGTTYKGNEKAFGALCDRLPFEFERWGRQYIVVALGNHENPKAFSHLQSLLDRSYNSFWIRFFDWDDVNVVAAVMEAFGKIGNISAITTLFATFSNQGSISGDTPLGWYRVRYQAALSLVKLTEGLTELELRTLYDNHKNLLSREPDVFRPFYDMSLFAEETAWVFFKAFSLHADAADLASDILSTMTQDWKSDFRRNFVRQFLSKESLTVTLKGTLDDQGRFIGRLGQFRLINNGRDVIQIHVDPSRLDEIYAHIGKVVVVRGELKSRRARSKLYPFVDDTYPLWIELVNIN